MSIKSEAASLIAIIDATHVNDGIAALETFADDFYGLEMGDMLEAVSVVLLTVGDAVRLANAIEQVAAIRQRPEPTSHQIDLGVEYLRTLFGSFRLVDSLGEGPAEAAAMTREVFEDVSPARVYAEVLTIIASGGTGILALLCIEGYEGADRIMADFVAGFRLSGEDDDPALLAIL